MAGGYSVEDLRYLRAQWDSGKSTQLIALDASVALRRPDLTKNAVIGVAHRQKWPSRPSPIRDQVRPSGRPSAVFTPELIAAIEQLWRQEPPLTERDIALRDQCREAGTAFFMKQTWGRLKAEMPPIPEDLMIKERPNARS